jgi:hypothetical protein
MYFLKVGKIKKKCIEEVKGNQEATRKGTCGEAIYYPTTLSMHMGPHMMTRHVLAHDHRLCIAYLLTDPFIS